MRAAFWRWGRATLAGSLARKLLGILAGVGVLGGLAIAVLLAVVIVPNFDHLEERAIAGNVERTEAVLSDFAAKVEHGVRDYGDWNTSYDYMVAPSRAFENESFSILAMQNLAVDGMAYVTPDRRILISRWVSDGRDAPAMRAELNRSIAGTEIERLVGGASSGRFYTRIGGQLVAMAAARVRRSDGSGTPRGFVLMARTVTPAQVSDLLQLKTTLDLTTPPTAVTIDRSVDTMAIAVPIAGLSGAPVAAVRFVVARDVSLLGKRMLWLAVAGAVLLLFVVLAALTFMIGRLVLRPLERVERHMQTVRASGSLGLLAEDSRDDEIGSLGKSFNAMLSQLRDLREQLEVQSFALGKSESAVAVMHNVRNALSPISAILSQGLALKPPVDPALVARASDELARDDISPDRREKLAAFVAGAVSAGDADREERNRQLQIGREAMGHVLEIIGSQQAAAHERPPLQPCDVTEIVARNATIARYSVNRFAAFNFPARPHFAMANRLLLSQVIGNLFSNAAEAIAASPSAGVVTVSIEEVGDSVTITIRDDGEGFAPDTARQLFQRGFSTRRHKSGGLGLHWCANSMLTMDGSLRLESEGPGKGAIAILTLKAAHVTTAVAA